MLKKENSSAFLVLSLLAVSAIQASYYQDTLFPIGLSGIMITGEAGQQINNCPYSNVGYPYNNPPLWTWLEERQLIDNLGVNCLGCEDIQPEYLADLDPNNPSQNNYLHKVCAPSFLTDKPIYLIIANYYTQWRYYFCPASIPNNEHCCEGFECDHHYRSNCTNDPADSCERLEGYYNVRPSTLFRSPHRPDDAGNSGGRGSMLFSKYNPNGWHYHGSHEENWATFDGDDLWRSMADEAVINFKDYFDAYPQDAQYVWGYNLMTEDYTKHIDKHINKHILTI